MMILKEAFRMQNKLTELESIGKSYLGRSDFVMKVTEKHMRKASNPGAEDEVIEKPKDIEFDVDKVVDVVVRLAQEKQKLAVAIAKAKPVELDAEISSNKDYQSVIAALRTMVARKSSEFVDTGRGYLINNEGNQTSYNYDIQTVQTIDFDRNVVKAIIKRLQKQVDEVSTSVDKTNITTEVDYNPI
ncbi:MAG: hypothetical protein IJ815_08750, partial [Lachnospiraceae bacterium]|nr:hypothetical protein [Lachnospiraceae bacterium]